jgi:hypothetical protein
MVIYGRGGHTHQPTEASTTPLGIMKCCKVHKQRSWLKYRRETAAKRKNEETNFYQQLYHHQTTNHPALLD